MAAILSAALALAAAARADSVDFVRVWPQWRDGASFKRISEYFTGRENDAGRQVRRTRPDSRDGYYFLARVRHPGVSLVGAKFVLQAVKPGAPDPVEYDFPAGTGPGEDVYELGLTGADWPDKKAHPVAWKLKLVSADGRVLTSDESFLWAKPGW